MVVVAVDGGAAGAMPPRAQTGFVAARAGASPLRMPLRLAGHPRPPFDLADIGIDQTYRERAWTRHLWQREIAADRQLPRDVHRLGCGLEEVRRKPPSVAARAVRRAMASQAATAMP